MVNFEEHLFYLKDSTGEMISSEEIKKRFDENHFVYLGRLKDIRNGNNYHVYTRNNLGIKLRECGAAIVHGENPDSIRGGLSEIEKITGVRFV